jgi:serine/threonine-protein kinase
MTELPARIARRHETPVSRSDGARTTGRMPEDLISEQVRRLAIFAGVAGAIWTFALLMDAIILPGLSDTWPRNWRAIPVEIAVATASLGIFAYIRLANCAPAAKSTIGLVFMLLNAVGIAALNAWAMPLPGPSEMHLSWMTVLILVYSMIAPTTPRKILVASLAAASLDPLAFGMAYLIGSPTPTPLAIVVMTWPNFACAVVAMLPSRVLQRIGRRLREAQEMGSYQLVEKLGTGGMGEVWRAKHRLLARNAAIKLVRPEVLGARTEAEARVMIRRFEREAQATAQLGSPHTIQVFDFGTAEDGTFYYVMELLAGRDLESLIREFGPLPANRAIYLLRQVCHSLADAHARGLVHRDIKPANIYVCRMGLEYDFVKVLDFGLVKFNRHSGGADTLATLDHTTSGTPAYMAPETILGDVHVDRRADVYSLGCVAYYLLTGQLVFEADTPMRMLMEHVNAQPIRPSQRTELPIPRELDELVMACLQKDPNLRPQDAEALFRMACECHTCEGWTPDLARSWWEVHMREFTGPLTISEAPEPGRLAMV